MPISAYFFVISFIRFDVFVGAVSASGATDQVGQRVSTVLRLVWHIVQWINVVIVIWLISRVHQNADVSVSLNQFGMADCHSSGSLLI